MELYDLTEEWVKKANGKILDFLVAVYVLQYTRHGCKDDRDGHRCYGNFSDGYGPIHHFSSEWWDFEILLNRFRSGWQGHAAAHITMEISDWAVEEDCIVTIKGVDLPEVYATGTSVQEAGCRAALLMILAIHSK